jgi:hypothetical protein
MGKEVEVGPESLRHHFRRSHQRNVKLDPPLFGHTPEFGALGLVFTSTSWRFLVLAVLAVVATMSPNPTVQNAVRQKLRASSRDCGSVKSCGHA